MTHTWLDAREECELYGGWLVMINNMKEYNCIMRHGIGAGLNSGYWIDVKDGLSTILGCGPTLNKVTFCPSRVICNCVDSSWKSGGDFYILKIVDDRHY